MSSPSRRRDVVVVASHLPKEGYFQSDRYRVDAVCCGDDFDYWRGLKKHWSSAATIVNIEHDLEVSEEHVDALLECPHRLCSHAYACHWVTTGLAHDVYAVGAGARDIAKHPAAYYLQGGEEWAQWSAIGLVKVAPEARIRPLERAPWNQLELSVERAVALPWHVHWDPPLIHHHW